MLVKEKHLSYRLENSWMFLKYFWLVKRSVYFIAFFMYPLDSLRTNVCLATFICFLSLSKYAAKNTQF